MHFKNQIDNIFRLHRLALPLLAQLVNANSPDPHSTNFPHILPYIHMARVFPK